jgi:hypothetical protein
MAITFDKSELWYNCWSLHWSFEILFKPDFFIFSIQHKDFGGNGLVQGNKHFNITF